MPFIPVVDTLKVVMNFSINSQQVINIFNFKYNSPPGLTERSALATAMHTFWTNQLKPQLTADIGLERIDVIDLNSASAPSTTLIIAPREVGTLSATVGTPSGMALVVTHRTALRGRNFRGRTYLAGHSGNALTSPTTYNLTNIGNILTAMAWLLNAVNTAAGIISVVSRQLNNAPRGTGITTPITGFSMDNLLDSQRRRLQGRGA